MSQELRQRPNIFLYYITVSKSKVKSWCVEKGYISKVKQTEGEESYISNKTLGEEAEGIRGWQEEARKIADELRRGKSPSFELVIGNKMHRRSLLNYSHSDVPSLDILPGARKITTLFRNLKVCASSLRLEGKDSELIGQNTG